MAADPMQTHRCPTCGRWPEFRDMRQIRTFPFCSERCRLVDLGRWLNEEYRIPSERSFEIPEDTENNA